MTAEKKSGLKCAKTIWDTLTANMKRHATATESMNMASMKKNATATESMNMASMKKNATATESMIMTSITAPADAAILTRAAAVAVKRESSV